MSRECSIRVRNALGVSMLAVVLSASSPAHAQAYPDRLIRIVVPYAAGGAVDLVLTPGTPEQFAAFIKSQTELWSGVIKSAGIRPD